MAIIRIVEPRPIVTIHGNLNPVDAVTVGIAGPQGPPSLEAGSVVTAEGQTVIGGTLGPASGRVQAWNVQWSGAQPYPDGTAYGDMEDSAAAITAAISKAKAIGLPLVASGRYRVDSTITLLDDTDVDFTRAEFVSTAPIAIHVGGSGGLTTARKSLRLPRLIAGTAHSNIGVTLTDVDGCEIWIPYVHDFEDGVVLNGDAQGVSYNTLVVGQINSYTRNLVFDAVNNGWSNQNTILGGRFTFSRVGSQIPGTRQVQIGTPTAANRTDGNTFVGCSFEGAAPEFHIQGYDMTINTFVGCRFETGGGDPRFSFLTRNGGSGSFGNHFVNCFGTVTVAVTQSSESWGNRFDTYEMDHVNRYGPHSVQHRNSNTGGVYQVYAIDQDIHATTRSSTNWRMELSANSAQFKNTADTTPRFTINTSNGVLNWSSGSAANDASLFRSGSNRLATGASVRLHVQNALEVDGELDHDGSTAGFYGVTPVTRRTLGEAATDAASTQTLANTLRQALIDLGLGQT